MEMSPKFRDQKCIYTKIKLDFSKKKKKVREKTKYSYFVPKTIIRPAPLATPFSLINVTKNYLA